MRTTMGIRSEVAHRPWPLPSGAWVMAQSWHDLLFAHWPIEVATLRAALPRGLELDTFEGRAWLGVVPFRMSGVRLRGTPPLPGLSAFPELNVRTYARIGDRPGVFFFSLDARNALAIAVARAWYHLPYFRARMSCERAGEGVRYEHERTDARGADGSLSVAYRPCGAVAAARPGTLEHWLTERYCLYAGGADGRVWRAEIHHRPWPLQPAEATFARNTIARAQGFELPPVEPLLHFSRRQDTIVWRPDRIL